MTTIFLYLFLQLQYLKEIAWLQKCYDIDLIKMILLYLLSVIENPTQKE